MKYFYNKIYLKKKKKKKKKTNVIRDGLGWTRQTFPARVDM